jgi:hypothetical protein
MGKIQVAFLMGVVTLAIDGSRGSAAEYPFDHPNVAGRKAETEEQCWLRIQSSVTGQRRCCVPVHRGPVLVR